MPPCRSTTRTVRSPDLAHVRARLAFSRACRDRMIERLERFDPGGAADEITAEYVEMAVWEALVPSPLHPGRG